MVQTALNALCDQFDGCDTVAFADLSTRMVLVTNSQTPESQDTLNALCQEADQLLQGGNQALVGTSTQLRLFVRATAEPSDALCCVCDISTDVAALLPALQTCLEGISSGEVSE